jgi:carbonic anhydrase
MTQKLIEGFKRFRAEHYGGKDALMPRLALQGQTPEFFIISCMDSRSLPGIIFDAAPGAFFPFTPMGAIVREYKQGTALAAGLEFALNIIGVKQIVILGHTGCGAIEALVGNTDNKEISSFVDVAQEGLSRAKKLCGENCTKDKLLRLAEKEIVHLSAENLRTYPSIAKGLKDGSLRIHQWLFDMDSGNLLEYSDAKSSFVPITDL